MPTAPTIRHAPEKATLMVALSKLLPAFKSHFFFLSLGFVGGLSLLVLEHYLVQTMHKQHDGVFIVILEHLGVALLVSAIAIFGYEWNMHINEANDLDEIIKHELEESRAMRTSLHMTDRLLAAMREEGRNNMGVALDALLGNDSASESVQVIKEQLINLATVAAGLRKGWASDHQMKFISVLLQEFVIQNAISILRVTDKSGEQHFRIKEPAQKIAGRLLAAQVSSMKKDDQYLVISDFASWDGEHLDEFLSEQIRAVKESGIIVKRIFYLTELRSVHSSKAAAILRKHYQCCRGAKGYQVAVLGKAEMKRLEEGGKIKRERAEDQHFGIFVVGGQLLRFKVEDEDLADLAISIDSDITSESLTTFDILWKEARKLTRKSHLTAAIAEMPRQ